MKRLQTLVTVCLLSLSSSALARSEDDQQLARAFLDLARTVYSDIIERLTTTPDEERGVRDELMAKKERMARFLERGQVRVASQALNVNNVPVHARAFFELAPVTIAGLKSDWDWPELKSNAAEAGGANIVTIIPDDTDSFFAALTLTAKGELRLRLRQSLDEGADVQARCEAAPWQENGQHLIKWTCRHHRLSGLVLDADLYLPSAGGAPTGAAIRGLKITRQENWIELEREFWRRELAQAGVKRNPAVKKLVLHELLRIADVADDNGVASWVYEPFPRVGAKVHVRAEAPIVWQGGPVNKPFTTLTSSMNLPIQVAPGQGFTGTIKTWWYDKAGTVVLIALDPSSRPTGLKRVLWGNTDGSRFYRDEYVSLTPQHNLHFYLRDLTEIKGARP